MLKLPIYMDNHATTPLDPRVLEAMMPYLTEDFGNAASRNHAFGWKAEAAVKKARQQVAELIGASESEIVFTSGATESDNLALKGVAEFYHHKGDHIITTQIEHKAILDSCKRLERMRQDRIEELKVQRLSQLAQVEVTQENASELAQQFKLDQDPTFQKWVAGVQVGARVTYLPVEKDGRVSLEKLAQAITDRTILVSVMLANNEIGTVQPLEEIGKLCRQRGVLFHSDAVQGIGKVPFDVNAMNVDLASITSHKIYGPKGVGALYIRRKPRVRIAPLIDGGGHERGMRSGTLPVASIVGFGKACELSRLERDEEAQRLTRLRNRLERAITDKLDMVTLNGSPEHRLPGNLNLSFAYVEGEGLMMAMKDVAVSSGSACTSASLEPSYVLRALGVEEDLAHSSIRFGLGRFNTEEEVDYVAALVVDKVRKLREMSPLYEMAKEGIDLKSIQWAAH